MNVPKELAELLEANNIGTIAATSGWSIHVGRAVDDNAIPDTTITIRSSGGEASNPKWLLDYPHVQVIVRGAANKYQTAFMKCTEIHEALIGLQAQGVDGGRIDSITGLGYINPLGFDSNERPEFTLNFRLIVEPNAPANSNRQPLT